MKRFKFSGKYQFPGKTNSSENSEISKAMPFEKRMANESRRPDVQFR